jgi:DNA phosphorothioation-associated putative methyltransferase
VVKVRAIRRQRLSRPLQLACAYGIVRRGLTYHDLGEGFGDDVKNLRRRGISATGSDPHYTPKSRPRAADVVGLVYVLNTIADPKTRSNLLRSAYRRARRALLVAARTDKAPGNAYRDGVVTSSGTYQRNWSSEQFARYVRRILDQEVTQLAPGVVVVNKRAK